MFNTRRVCIDEILIVDKPDSVRSENINVENPLFSFRHNEVQYRPPQFRGTWQYQQLFYNKRHPGISARARERELIYCCDKH